MGTKYFYLVPTWDPTFPAPGGKRVKGICHLKRLKTDHRNLSKRSPITWTSRILSPLNFLGHPHMEISQTACNPTCNPRVTPPVHSSGVTVFPLLPIDIDQFFPIFSSSGSPGERKTGKISSRITNTGLRVLRWQIAYWGVRALTPLNFDG